MDTKNIIIFALAGALVGVFLMVPMLLSWHWFWVDCPLRSEHISRTER